MEDYTELSPCSSSFIRRHAMPLGGAHSPRAFKNNRRIESFALKGMAKCLDENAVHFRVAYDQSESVGLLCEVSLMRESSS
jgi:hypothetical protein